jgi:hypothetical protein
MSGIVKLATILEACRAPNDEIAVGGTLREVLEAVVHPSLLQDEPWALIVKEGFRSLTNLRSLREHHLRDMGFGMGDAAGMLDAIQPRQVKPAAQEVAAGEEPRAPPVEVRGVPVKVGPMRPFPETNTAGFPDVNGWEVYGLALQAAVGPAVSLDTAARFTAIDRNVKDELVGWQRGCADDVLIWNTMLNAGVGALPAELVLLLPGELKSMKAGIEVYQHIAATVNTMSDQAARIILEWFQNPDSVLVRNKHLLLAVLQQWREYRAMLVAADMEQSDLMCRLSLEKIYALLPDVKQDVSSMKSAVKISKTPVTTELVLSVVQDSA